MKQNSKVLGEAVIENGVLLDELVTVGEQARICNGAAITFNSVVGRKVIFGAFSQTGRSVTIGRETAVGEYTYLRSQAKIGEQCVIGSRVETGEWVRIGNGCEVDSDVYLKNGRKIKDNTLVRPAASTITRLTLGDRVK
jgi:UDP-3-O-[3-hydroxymyristoyl] glucosamine N-acyltransferase